MPSGIRFLGLAGGNPELRFYFHLARDLGMPVGEMLERMSSHELTEWRALYQIEADEKRRANEMARQRARKRKR